MLVVSKERVKGSSWVFVASSRVITSVVIVDVSSVPVSCKMPPPVVATIPVAGNASVSVELDVKVTMSFTW